MKYTTCPLCGSNLDHGEICDCTKKNDVCKANTAANVIGCDLSAAKDLTAKVKLIALKQNDERFVYYEGKALS